ncbi:Small integral membrane protein 4 [Lamellibrachia satsuma]|nr:Small integral membrane protein 4 [Lamellibrachia satsuma]
MIFYSRRLKQFLDAVPGKRIFGLYRFLPFFFLLGATVEFSMIKWTVGETNFYSVYKRKEAEKQALELLQTEQIKSAT